jgi:hypothetical protein
MIYKGINFNGSSYTSGDCKLLCNFNNAAGAKVFLAERHVVCLEYAGGDDPYIGPDSDTRIATYARDENNRVIIDLTDWLRTHYANGTMSEQEISVFCPLNDDMFDLFYGVGGIFLRDPQTIPVPNSSIEYLRITPPSRMLQSDAITPMAQSFIWQNADAPARRWKYRQIGVSAWTNIEIGTPFYIEQIGVEITSNGGEGCTFRLAPTECGVRYALIKWRSFVGPYKMHNFEIKSQKTEAQDDYSLLMVDNSYNEIKGSEESLIFSIDELDTYDLWYYSDILTSSEVSLLAHDGKFIGSFSQGQIVGGVRLEITTKSVTIPSGDRADGKIEFEAKIKRYDAVTL